MVSRLGVRLSRGNALWPTKYGTLAHPHSYTIRFSFRFPAFLGGGFWYSVISSRPYTPPALLASLKYAYSPCVLSSCVVHVDFFFFFSSLHSLFRCRLDIVCFIISFCCGYYAVLCCTMLCCLLGFGFCCDSYHMICIWYLVRIIPTLISPFSFLSEVHDLFQLLVIACIIFGFLSVFLLG